MKRLIRKVLRALGLYETCGEWVARAQAIPRGIRISRTAEGNYRIRDAKGRTIVINRRHRIYLADMVLYFDFFFEAVLPDAGNEVHYEQAAWHTPRDYNRQLFFTSFAESASTLDLYHQLSPLKPGGVVLDVGAYCGLTSIDFAARVGENGRVYAFEADPENFLALQKNADASSAANLVVEHLAVWKTTGELEFQSDGTAGAGVAAVSTRSQSTVTVKSTTLADYIARRNIGHIDLLKIDVEGSEADILASSRDVLRQFRPTLIVELHPVHDVWTTDACREILESEGYRTRIVPQPGTSCPLMVATRA